MALARSADDNSEAVRGEAPDGEEGKRRPSLRPLAALAPHLLRHQAMLALAGLALVASALAMLAVPLALRSMIDHGFSAADTSGVNRAFLYLLAIGVVLSIASSARIFLVNWLGERVVADVRAAVFDHLVALGPPFYERTRSGEVLSRLTADTTQIKGAAGSALSQAARNLIMLIGAFSMMLVTSPRLAALVLVAIPAIVLPLVAIGRAVRRLSRRAQDTLADATGYAGENLAAVRTMQAATAERAVSARFTSAVERAFDAAVDRLKARAGLTALVILLVVSSVTGVLWYGAGLVMRGELTGGTLGQFILYAFFAAGALAELSEVWSEVQQAAGAAERLGEILAVKPSIVSPARPVAMPEPPQGRIAFEGVSHDYESSGEGVALNDLSFTVAPGETVAIVGPSGAGKSTIFNLLLRFWDPTTGRILVDGVALPDAELAALRQRIALVPQDIALFAGSVRENIRYGSPAASDADVGRAAEAAQAAGFIARLPRGYDTELGERGVTLSGGQRQRIAIARALLRDAPILLLDEATSALDAESEEAVQCALERAMEGRTTLVIAHRLATIQRADRILVIDGGRLVEQGTHAELVARSGLYSRLAALQFRSAAE